MTRTCSRLPAWLLLAAALTACDDDARCVPGQVAACACLGGGPTGVQTCDEDGSYGACEGCAIPDASVLDSALGDAGLAMATPGDPCTPPSDLAGSDAPSAGACDAAGALNCGPDGRYARTDTCAAGEVCASVPVSVPRSGQRLRFAVCAPASLEACTPFELFECADGVSRSCPNPIVDRWLDPSTSREPEHGYVVEVACRADERCHEGVCALDAPPCEEESIRCEDGQHVLVCAAGRPPVRSACDAGFVCASALACGGPEGLCVPDAERCAPGEPERSCDGPDRVRVCNGGGTCFGSDECACLPQHETCDGGTRCQDGTCVPDVDCTAGTRCEGTLWIGCEGLPQTFDCARHAMTCGGTGAASGCRTATDCADATSPVCEADAAVVTGCCPPDGRMQTGLQTVPCVPGTVARFDCNASGAPVTYACSLGMCGT